MSEELSYDVLYWISRYLEAVKKKNNADKEWAILKLKDLGHEAPTCSEPDCSMLQAG